MYSITSTYNETASFLLSSQVVTKPWAPVSGVSINKVMDCMCCGFDQHRDEENRQASLCGSLQEMSRIQHQQHCSTCLAPVSSDSHFFLYKLDAVTWDFERLYWLCAVFFFISFFFPLFVIMLAQRWLRTINLDWSNSHHQSGKRGFITVECYRGMDCPSGFESGGTTYYRSVMSGRVWVDTVKGQGSWLHCYTAVSKAFQRQ